MREEAKTPAPEVAGRRLPRHIAIIMDGNGRWAAERGMARALGHKAGVEAVRRCVRMVAKRGIPYLTLFSFSSENWIRPQSEIADLFSLLRRFIRKDLAELHQEGVRIRIIGRRDKVPDDIVRMLDEAEALTRDNTAFNLIIAFNYGGRAEIADAARRAAQAVERGEISSKDIDEARLEGFLDTAGVPDPDLLLRTSGEARISNFLLWQCAYSEFVFLPVYWPDFDEKALDDALNEYAARDRRFGGVEARA
ncbi:MAG: isoprenyl transferase [Rhodobiaceae bacterium]|nr:isoprenyl transferase [Rhodobiaceae bacterium]MCC0013089.1 isoprenyl transferase [Rhodobiaceae bacterium]MCC0019241.1 isoprenyl transferase [Rhodobiaceae bacterium]MCC0062286.1 isoprenyl transferase [Rhodobiaceae bacterium]